MSKNKPPQETPSQRAGTDRREDNPHADAPPGGEAAAEDLHVADGSGEYETLRTDLEQMKDRALRVQAELENYRKRVAREMADERRYAELPLLRDLLPMLDNMLRAIEAAEKSGEAPQLLEGFKLVFQQFEGILQRHHCDPIQALHEPFDPNFHEAILQQPSVDHPPGTVIHVAQAGYRLYDRVVRPTQVIVSGPPADRPKTGEEQNGP
ncbi:MAG: nucleotide exchange factor GrpE [Rhodopirellula sp.]|nr:nucleotide exchange factor GrpE [Rhodopirellula sp.]